MLVQKVKKVTKVEPANGLFPVGRYCHQSVLIGTEEGQKPYLLSFAGLNTQRQSMSDIIIYDIINNIWTPLAQVGFIPANEEGQFGRYNFGMSFDRMSKQVVIFGG